MINLLDIVTSIVTVISLALVKKGRYWWIIYSFNSLLFSFVVFSKGLIGLCLMGLCLSLVGVYNYRKE